MPEWANKKGIVGTFKDMCKNLVGSWNLANEIDRTINNNWPGIIFNGCQQELKKAILEDLVRLGKANGLHSFEQVGRRMSSASLLFVFIPLKTGIFRKNLLFFLKVKNIYIHDEMFSIQNGLLTPTLKAKRPELKEFFKDKIEELYCSVSLWRLADIILLPASNHWLPAVHQHIRNLNQTCARKFKMPKLQQNAIQNVLKVGYCTGWVEFLYNKLKGVVLVVVVVL